MATKDNGKTLYKVEFWEENQEHKPIYVAYVMAKTPTGAKNSLKFRGYQAARKEDKVWLSHLFHRDDVLVTAKPDEKWVAKQKFRRELSGTNVCPQCSVELDDDYCQACGWRRQSWLDRAKKDMATQGENNRPSEPNSGMTGGKE